MLTFVCISHVGGVFPSQMNPGFHCSEQVADVSVVNRVAHGGGGVMVWAGVRYRQQTQVHYIDGILKTQRSHDDILLPIVVPFIHDLQLTLQLDKAQSHVARISAQFLEAENIPVHHPSILTRHVSNALERRVQQRVPVPANIQPLKRSGPTFQRLQSTLSSAHEKCEQKTKVLRLYSCSV